MAVWYAGQRVPLWPALGCSEHVEKWNKHIKKCVKLVINTTRNKHFISCQQPRIWWSWGFRLQVRRKNVTQLRCRSLETYRWTLAKINHYRGRLKRTGLFIYTSCQCPKTSRHGRPHGSGGTLNVLYIMLNSLWVFGSGFLSSNGI